MSRHRDVDAKDKELTVFPERLDWAVRTASLAGVSQEALADRVTARLSLQAKRRPDCLVPPLSPIRSKRPKKSDNRGRTPPKDRRVSAAAISYWRSGKRRTCRRSVLTALAAELEKAGRFRAPVDFFHTDGNRRFIEREVALPGLARSVWIEVQWGGGLGRAMDDGEVVGSFVKHPDEGGPRMLAEMWTDLSFWREAFLVMEDDDGDFEHPNAQATAAQDFFHHMIEALKIALRPIDRESKLREGCLRELLSLGDPQVHPTLDEPATPNDAI